MGRRTRATLATLAVVVAVLISASPALAKSFWITSADVTIAVNDDGSLSVTESITFDFDGSFTGAYRDINLRPGESISEMTVQDSTRDYAIGGCVELGCSSPAGTYGVAVYPTFVRVVWHHDSTDTLRTFVIAYVVDGLATVYDDVVDLNFRVWGEQWAVGVDWLAATVLLPGSPEAGEVLVWGHPSTVDGETSLGEDGVTPTLEASNVPPESWVEMRTAFPSDLLTTNDGARLVGGAGLPLILSEEAQFARDAELSGRAGRLGAAIGAAALLLIAGGLGLATYLRYGKEPRVDYDREYEQEPPSELSPAEVGVLLSQGKVTEKEFTATLFDLIRQGSITAAPTQVTRSTWAGLRTETISDLELGLGVKETGLRDFEQSVMTVVKRVLDEGPQPLTEFRDRIRDDAKENAATYGAFKSRAGDAVTRANLLDTSGNVASLLTVIVAGLLAAAAWLVLPRILEDRPGGAVMAFLIVFGMVVGVLLLIAFLLFRRVRVKRTQAGAFEAERWLAFRRYLADFSRLDEAPAISLALWDRFLIYAIVFGVATEVLEQARLHAPPELETQSSIFWYGSYGYSGGNTENAFSGLESALSGAFTPPSSGGSGGGFSGGGEAVAVHGDLWNGPAAEAVRGARMIE